MSSSEYSADEKLPSDKDLEKNVVNVEKRSVDLDKSSVDLEKGPPPILEDVEGIRDEPLARHETDVAHLMNLGEGIVGWDSRQDPQNPLNWPAPKRRIVMALISMITFCSPLGSSIFAPGITYTMAELHETSQAIGSLMITIYLLGYALGPLFLSPLSEIYGRYIVIVISTWTFNVFLLGCGFVHSMPGLIVLRLLAGTGGSAVMAIAPAIVADLYHIERRGFAMGIVFIIQCLSPAIGPICGGFIAQQLGWRWAYWILLIASGVVTTIITFVMPECYAPTVLDRKTKRLRKELGRNDLRSVLALPVTKGELMKRSLIRPMKLLTRSPIVFLFSLYVATIYGMLYLCFTTIPSVYSDQYGWSIEFTGLVYISFGIGMFCSLLVIMKTSDSTMIKMRKKNGGVFEPEMRLPYTIYFAVLTGPGLLVYGWTADKHVHWIVPMLGLIPFGFGMVGLFTSCQTYIVDSFTRYAASAIAATTCLRSLVGAFLPFAGPPLFASLGLGWGNTLLGGIAIIMCPLPVLFYKYGRIVRERFPVEL
ncbi:membrane transporter [Rhizodiscina lignyota]|uniref:Membrane transporter n=1 Tax=Rhizodiscina lignyota TaxID=1504668 RepID=A0A9P4MBP9_9PEZI|nr:membrane transporter [Rhizodiscina lignyota]